MESKPRHKSKTNWFGMGLMLFSGVQQYLPQVQEQLSASTYNWIIFGSGVVVVILREITKDPVG